MRFGKRRGAGIDRFSLAGDDLCQAEVQHLGASALGDKNVGGLYIAVDDAFAVRVIERIGDGNGDIE